MGSCLTRLSAEMKAPPPRSSNWDSLSPQRPTAYVPEKQQKQRSLGNGEPLGRMETPSGIPGLTYDAAGRPVWVSPIRRLAKCTDVWDNRWREENAVKVQSEHRENRRWGVWDMNLIEMSKRRWGIDPSRTTSWDCPRTIPPRTRRLYRPRESLQKT